MFSNAGVSSGSEAVVLIGTCDDDADRRHAGSAMIVRQKVACRLRGIAEI